MYLNLCLPYVYLHMEKWLFLYYVVREVLGMEAEKGKERSLYGETLALWEFPWHTPKSTPPSRRILENQNFMER
jgi:hypothetical protein